jgi:threonine synthase
MQSFLKHIECSYCHAIYDTTTLLNLCPKCHKPLFAIYDLESAREHMKPEVVAKRPTNMWRYAEVMPVVDAHYRFTLGEGFTSLLELNRLGKGLGIGQLYAKDEGANPTRSFKARGLAAAVARAAELGAKAVAIPTAGNAGSAMAAYAARAGLPAYVFAPKDIQPIFVTEMELLGAHVELVDGLINDCARYTKEGADIGRWFDVATLKEPYRVEGKKTMAYELAEQLNWQLPDVIVYPTGGGTGIIGMWKAFDEMEALGWIDSKRPKMVSVQSSGCAPIVRAYEENTEFAEFWDHADTVAGGLRVPAAVGDFLILQAVRDSNGTAIAVDDDEIMDAMKEIGSAEGLLVAPEAAATMAALRNLVKQDFVKSNDRVVLFFTGGGLKHATMMNGAVKSAVTMM